MRFLQAGAAVPQLVDTTVDGINDVVEDIARGSCCLVRIIWIALALATAAWMIHLGRYKLMQTKRWYPVMDHAQAVGKIKKKLPLMSIQNKPEASYFLLEDPIQKRPLADSFVKIHGGRIRGGTSNNASVEEKMKA